MEHSAMCKRVNVEMWDALSTVPPEDRYSGDDAYRCNCGLERIAQEHAEMKLMLTRLCNEVSGNTGAFEFGMREAMGNTNYQCLVDREQEARTLLQTINGKG